MEFTLAGDEREISKISLNSDDSAVLLHAELHSRHAIGTHSGLLYYIGAGNGQSALALARGAGQRHQSSVPTLAQILDRDKPAQWRTAAAGDLLGTINSRVYNP